MCGAGEFADVGGLGLLLGAAHAETDVLVEAAAPSPAAATLPAPANAPVGATGSPEPATGLDQEQHNPQQGDEQPAWAALNPLKLAAARRITKSNPGQAKNNLKLTGWQPAPEKPTGYARSWVFVRAVLFGAVG